MHYSPVSANTHHTSGQMNQELRGKMKVVHHGHEKCELSVSAHFQSQANSYSEARLNEEDAV